MNLKVGLKYFNENIYGFTKNTNSDHALKQVVSAGFVATFRDLVELTTRYDDLTNV